MGLSRALEVTLEPAFILSTSMKAPRIVQTMATLFYGRQSLELAMTT